MGFRDTLKNLTTRAESAAVEHKEEIRQTVEKAEAAADQRTGGKYHETIETTGARVNAYLENFDSQPAPTSQSARAATPRAPDDPASER